MTWRPFPRRYVAKQVRMVVLVFCVAASVAFPLLVVAFRAVDDEPLSPTVVLEFSLVFAAISASFGCLIALVRIARCARARVDGEFPHRTAITDVVVKGRLQQLSLEDRVLATKYAVALLPYLAFQYAQLVLLTGAMLLSQLAMGVTASHGPNPVTVGAMVLSAVVAVGSVALWAMQSRKVRRFLAENQRLLGAPVV